MFARLPVTLFAFVPFAFEPLAVRCSAGELERGDGEIVSLWPGSPPGEDALSADFRDRLAEAESRNTPERSFGISAPSLTAYPAEPGNSNGTAVVVFPGGGYNILAWQHEGLEIARWLNSIGVGAFVVSYRVPRRPGDFILPPLQDAQRALRLVRSRADAWGIDPKRIGALGFSAGGNLVLNAATRFNEATYAPVDAADRLSCRPDFVVPIYAAYLGDKSDDTRLGDSLVVAAETPPTFLAVTQDDKNRGAHAAEYFAELTRRGVAAEVHVFTRGGHGYGIRPSDRPVSRWHRLCESWMRELSFLPPKSPADQGG